MKVDVEEALAATDTRLDFYSPVPLTGDATDEDRATIRRSTSVYVYQVPVRLWHWVNAAAIMVLIVTGYLIGAPPPS